MEYFTSSLVFYILASLALVTALLVILKASPVASAICMALSFACAAGVMFQLNAEFLGVIQILVYTGAIMVLILFVVMLLNLDDEPRVFSKPLPLVAGIVIAAIFMAQLTGVVFSIPGADETCCTACCEKDGKCPFEDFLIGNGNAEPATPATAPIAIGMTQPPFGQSPSVKLPEITSNLIVPEGSSLEKSLASGVYPDTALLGCRLFSKYNMELIIAGLTLLAAAIGAVVLTRRPDNN